MGRKAGGMVLISAGDTICWTQVAQHQVTAAVTALARAGEQLLPIAAFFLPGQPNPQHSQDRSRDCCLCARQAQRREDEDKRRETHSSKKKGQRHISKSWIHILIVNWFELVSS